MPAVALDACCLIDLLASGHAAEILRACGYAWHLPVAVQAEVQFVRQPDPADARKVVFVPVDLSGLISAGLLTACQPEAQAEQDLFTLYAVQFRSDGEAMCLALAQARGWHLATDDKKAIRIGQQAGLTVLSSPQLLKTWSEVVCPDQSTIVKALQDIERLAQFRPNATMLDCQWWLDQLGT